MTNLLLHQRFALVGLLLVGEMDPVPLSLVEGLKSQLHLSQIPLVLLLQFLECILQGNTQLFLLLLQTLRRMDGANYK